MGIPMASAWHQSAMASVSNGISSIIPKYMDRGEPFTVGPIFSEGVHIFQARSEI